VKLSAVKVSAVKVWAVIAICVTLAGCASAHVSLLNDEGGGSGAVVVMDPATGAERGQLIQANTRADLGGSAVQARPLKRSFDKLLAVMPPPAKVYTLYFIEGTTQITADSQPTLDQLRQIITPTSDVQITGHTDTTGDPAANDKLSIDRATEVRAALVQDGLPVGNARVTGRGQRELRVQTGPGVSEPLNRRVEVIVR
jgi:outer membrane protein OmpA-like peptidoglycan-associated protein